MDNGKAAKKRDASETENMDGIECKTSKIGVVVVQSPREMEKNFYRQQKWRSTFVISEEKKSKEERNFIRFLHTLIENRTFRISALLPNFCSWLTLSNSYNFFAVHTAALCSSSVHFVKSGDGHRQENTIKTTFFWEYEKRVKIKSKYVLYGFPAYSFALVDFFFSPFRQHFSFHPIYHNLFTWNSWYFDKDVEFDDVRNVKLYFPSLSATHSVITRMHYTPVRAKWNIWYFRGLK